MTNIVGSAIMGVTLGCARCHDHKFDPIRHTDYYRMEAFFAGTHADDVPMAPPDVVAEWKVKDEAHKKEMAAVKKSMKGLEGPELAKMEKKLEELEDKAPTPPPSLWT